ncbi:MAG: ThuA domain-containing protein [Bacteroidota bacterium]
MRLFVLFLFSATLLSLLFCTACTHSDDPPRILVFSKTEGYRHACIPTGIAALRKLCRENNMVMDTSEEGADFNEKNLSRYAAVLFLCTTGDVLNPEQENAFERYIQAGGGFVGVHSATDTEYGWKWFGGLSGGYFNGHPAIQDATLNVLNHDHPATRHLKGDTWMRKDEWYNIKEFNPTVTVLLALDENSYKGGTMCQHGEKAPCHPISWYHDYDGGRSFYTGLGHTLESYAEPDFLKHLLGGIKYAVGDNKRLHYERCKTAELPDHSRFVKTVLATDLTEPMEFEMLPDGKILLIERRGALKLFNPESGMVTLAHKLPVYDKEEDGLLGLALDPKYPENHWIYLYYSPVGDESVNYLSRFVFVGDSLDTRSEIVMLKVAVQRVECCHAAGCIEFDGDGMLYLSTGDNSNPFASEGYAPLDERPGRSPWDSQKSSANTMDLRGKILRIKPLPDGTYKCPPGNLFPEGSNGRPEIYVMGCRNPFRISLDSRRKLLFWGEVGPDAGEPDTTRGPAGHDEVNRARAAGFFGWPYFVANNKPYRERDFTTGKFGAWFNPEHPVNNSPNNTGARDLPPAQPAFIWYPYSNSPDFPLLGNGGRSAMAGPVYYADEYPAETRFPDYYNGKLITYDWMRNWMMAVTLDSLGNFSRMETFGDSIKLSRPMDMFMDKNGSLWVLEYGTQWFASNPDARLSRIDYVRGNRPPMPQLQADKTAGAAPLKVVFSAAQTKDYDGGMLQYELDFGDESQAVAFEGRGLKPGSRTRTHGPAPADASIVVRRQTAVDYIEHTFEKAGEYVVQMRVTDEQGLSRLVKQKIMVGNEPPVVRWDLGGKNRSFYQPGDTLHYRLTVEDREDGSLADGRIPPTSVATSINYLETGFDITSIAQGHQSAMQAAEYAKGKTIIDRSDCKTCHAVDRQINGPSFQAVAARYRKNEFAVRDLSKKIIKGGAGNWGQTVMSAHPQLTEEDAGEMVRWILTLGDPPKPKQSAPLSGDYALKPAPQTDPKKKPVPGTFIFQAGYRDRGSDASAPLEAGETIALRPAFQQAESADSMSRNIRTYRPSNGDTVVLNELKHRSFFLFKRCDLSKVHTITVGLGSGDAKYRCSGGRIELHLDAADGPLLGTATIEARNNPKNMEFSEVQIQVSGTADGKYHNLFFVLKNEKNPSEFVGMVDWVRFEL